MLRALHHSQDSQPLRESLSRWVLGPDRLHQVIVSSRSGSVSLGRCPKLFAFHFPRWKNGDNSMGLWVIKTLRVISTHHEGLLNVS